MKVTSILCTGLAVAACCMAGCGGGGGGSDSGGSSGVFSGTWNVNAPITSEGCDVRTVNVNQDFTFTDNGDTVTVDSGMISLTGTEENGSLTVGFDEASSACSRNYSATFSNMTATTGSVVLSIKSTCEGAPCENVWTGTATKQ